MAECEVYRAAAKRGLVRGLVHHHEQEGDEISLRDDQRDRPQQAMGRDGQPDQRAEKHDRAVVAGRTNQALKVRSRR
jgi:hypothetical protein